MQFHLDMLIEQNLDAGMSPAEAQLAAQRVLSDGVGPLGATASGGLEKGSNLCGLW
jgi:hypothetical protein